MSIYVCLYLYIYMYIYMYIHIYTYVEEAPRRRVWSEALKNTSLPSSEPTPTVYGCGILGVRV